MMSEIVAAVALLRRSEKAMPTCEKRRSTVAELAGQPRYWRARHHREVEELLGVLLPPVERVPLRLVLDLGQREVRSELVSMRTVGRRRCVDDRCSGVGGPGDSLHSYHFTVLCASLQLTGR